MLASSLVLIALLKDKRDLEIARVLGWYRIPLKTAPKTVAVDYLAFYQTAKFGEEKWAVNYVAPVKGHELVTRAELLRTQLDHPRAGEMYYKIQLGPLERLPRPIPSLKWRRFTFAYTTGERLMAATEINDLITQSAEREQLWKALYERGLQAEKQYTVRPSAPQIDLALLCALGNLGVMVGSAGDEGSAGKTGNEGNKGKEGKKRSIREAAGWRYLNVTEAELQSDLPGVVQRIAAAAEELGGVAQSPMADGG